MKAARLYFPDGTFAEGHSVGASGTAVGELCFNTGMTGYQEVFTDPSYRGQVMVTANVHIGNYGIRLSESESPRVQIAALVCREFSSTGSRYGSDGNLGAWLQEQGVVAIAGLDTRALVSNMRDLGPTNVLVTTEDLSPEQARQQLASVPSMEGLELSSSVSSQTSYDLGQTDATFRVALWDFGTKRSIVSLMADEGCLVRVFPYNSTPADFKAFGAHGLLLSNGPGDPGVMNAPVEGIRAALKEGLPVFGICMGHQLLGRALGLETHKMHHGHRGINHPVKNLETGHCEITAQNHGFALKREELIQHPEALLTHVNLNDGTVEGIRARNFNAFSVQYHPEAAAGPWDSRYLFRQFVERMKDGASR